MQSLVRSGVRLGPQKALCFATKIIIIIKAASGIERALAPPRPSGSATVGEKARHRSKHRIQLNKFVKMTVQLY